MHVAATARQPEVSPHARSIVIVSLVKWLINGSMMYLSLLSFGCRFLSAAALVLLEWLRSESLCPLLRDSSESFRPASSMYCNFPPFLPGGPRSFDLLPYDPVHSSDTPRPGVAQPGQVSGLVKWNSAISGGGRGSCRAACVGVRLS